MQDRSSWWLFFFLPRWDLRQFGTTFLSFFTLFQIFCFPSDDSFALLLDEKLFSSCLARQRWELRNQESGLSHF